MKPKFNINEVVRIMVSGVILRIHEVYVTKDDIGDKEQAIKYIAVSDRGAILHDLDERAIMKEPRQEYGKNIPMAGDIDVSKEKLLPAQPVKVDKTPEKKTTKQKYKRRRSGGGKRPQTGKKKGSKKSDKGGPFSGVPDF